MIASKLGEFHPNYATVKSRGLESPVYTFTVHKMPVRKSGYEFVSVLKHRYYVEESGIQTAIEERFASSISRSRQTVIQLVANNAWEYFVTLTVSPESDVDRYNLSDCKAKILEFFSNYGRRSGAETDFKYVLIPEFHTDGAVHFHGVMRGINPRDLAINEHGYYDFVPYCNRFGFCNMGKIKDQAKCASYISKYISKNMFLGIQMESGTHLYSASHGLNKDKVHIVGVPVVNPSEFIELGYESLENEYCTKIFIEDSDIALSCVAPFEREYKLGVNLPKRSLDADTKKYLKRRAVIKYCNHYGINTETVSIETTWNTILEKFCYVLNDYDHLKEEHDSLKKIRSHMDSLESGILNGFAYIEEAASESELPFKVRPAFEPCLEYEQTGLCTISCD